MEKQLTAIVLGSVQGVNFRYFAQRTAESLSITGTVQNLPDGSVKVVAESEEGTLKEFIEILKQGPPASHVKNVAITWSLVTHSFSDFSIIHT